MKPVTILIIFSSILCLAACGPQRGNTTVSSIATDTPVVSANPTNSTPSNQTPSTTSTPAQAQINTNQANVRKGPSTLDKIAGVYNLGELVTVHGLAPGGGWVSITTADGVDGWISRKLITFGQVTPDLPTVNVPDCFVVKGKVTDAAGKLLPGIILSINRTLGDVTFETRTETDNVGEFYAFIPTLHTGKWNVTVIGANCDSPIMDSNCHFAGKFSQDGQITIDLPAADSWLDFIYTP